MKYIMTSLLLLIVVGLNSQSRNHPVAEEKIEARKIAFLTDVLDLTAAEAQTFWPAYNDYKKADKELKAVLRSKENADAKTQLHARLDYEVDSVTLKKEYTLKVEELLGADRALLLIKSERKFREKLLNRFKDHHRKGR